MSTFTENYNLIKPDESDYYDVQDFNKNFDTIDTSLFGQYVVGMITAALVGYLAIWMVRYISSKGRFSIFSLYCAAMGIFAIVWSLVVA